MLEVKGVSKRFGGVTAISNVSFTSEPGHIIGLIGPNGAGKTTLFNLISGFIKSDTGAIFFNGKRIDRLSPNQVAKEGVGRCFQITKVFHNMSVLDNLRAVSRNQNLIDEVLNIVEIEGLKNETAGTLSLFNQKRVELGMALCIKPRLLLLDEPTSGLASHEKNFFENLIQKLKEDFGVLILLIEHDVRMALNLSSQLIVLYYGSVLAAGEPGEVIKNKDVVQKYLGRMAV